MDNAPGHPRTQMNIFNQINVAFMPGKTISVLQPMDQGVILTFKFYYLRNTSCKTIAAIDNDSSYRSAEVS